MQKNCRFAAIATGAFPKEFIMQQSFKDISNYVLSALLIIGGIAFLSIYIGAPDMEDQPMEMLIGSLFLLLSGILSLPPVIAKIGTGVSKILTLVFLVVAAILAYLLFNTVDEEIEYQADKARIDAEVIQRLKDIRTAQEEYFSVKGYYASNFDSLMKFVKAPMVPVPWISGDLADSLLEKTPEEQAEYIVHRDSLPSMGMTVEEAVASGYSVRDTNYVSVYDQFFADDLREKKGLPMVSVDSLPYSPYSGQKFILKTDIIEVSGTKQSVVQVKDPTPFGKEGLKLDTLMFGSLSEPSTSGNWGTK